MSTTLYKRFLRLEPLEDRALLSTTWYVATTGSNSNAGTSLAAPFQTIQKAASVAQAGDTVLHSRGNLSRDRDPGQFRDQRRPDHLHAV